MENIISSGIMKSLKLNTIKHLTPYKINWVKMGIEVPVNFKCHVIFSIGKKFKCEVQCDVQDMDVSHLILGHPWNVYSFEWEEKIIKLLPSHTLARCGE